MCGNGNLQAPVLFFLPSGRLFLWLPEVPDSHPPLSIQRRFRCNPPAHFLSFPNGNTRNAPDSFPLPLCKNSADKVLHTENDLLTKKKSLKARLPPKRKRSELSKPDYPISSDSMNLQQYKTSTQHSILHSVPLTHIRKNVLSGKKHTERKLLQSSKPYTTK